VRHFQTTSIRLEQQANTSAKRDPAPKIIRGQSKVFKDADAAVKDLKSGAVILSAGFGLCGTAGKFPQMASSQTVVFDADESFI
jgi:3-oxoacid CoA-transferase